MFASSHPSYLLASSDPTLLQAVEPALLATGAAVSVVLSAEAALAAMTAPHPPSLALLDVRLPGMEMGQVLAAARAHESASRFPIALISDSLSDEWIERLREGVIDDIIPTRSESPWWPMRVELVLRAFRRARHLNALQELATERNQRDVLTGALNRAAMLSLLFCETDRVQRMGTSLCAILLDIDDFGHWNSRLGTGVCDELLVEVTARIQRLLRSYDLFGRIAGDQFLLGLPGCSGVNAVLLAERIRMDVFGIPFRVDSKAIRLSACFAVASSQGRSPVVLLRELEDALRLAAQTGPETIQSATDCPEAQSPPVGFFSPATGDDLLAW